jgi:hypothetical protein
MMSLCEDVKWVSGSVEIVIISYAANYFPRSLQISAGTSLMMTTDHGAPSSMVLISSAVRP